MHRTVLISTLVGALVTVGWSTGARAQQAVRRLAVKEYVSKMKAGWIGQMAGVGWGGPTEFKVKGEIMSEDRVPKWSPGMINQFNQDDIYVEMTFLRTLEVHGLDCTIRQAGIDFANSGYPLWHANRAGRDNLRRGIAPPDSGHPEFNKHADDIDYQIEADYSGLIAPGLPNFAIGLGEKFGRLMNYGDGMYAGQFVGGMYAEAFFENDMVKIAEAGLGCIPAQSQYAEMVRDLLAWFKKNPDDWQKTWHWIEEKYHKDPKYTHGLCSKPGGKGAFSIDAKLNGAYILMGLFYGKGDPDQTILISTRCGQDSDCNPANSGGILFTTLGFEKLPDRFKSALNPEGKFSHTPYTFPALVEVSKKLVRQAVEKAGGKIETDDAGEEVFVIPVLDPKPSPLEHVAKPGPIANSKFTDEEMAEIKPPAGRGGKSAAKIDISTAVAKVAPGWKVKDCGADMDPGLRAEWGGKKNVLVTHPLNRDVGCTLSRMIEAPAAKKTVLRVVVANDPRGDFDLVVKAGGKELLKKTIKVNTEDAPDKWETVAVDLSPLAGQAAAVEIINQPTGWSWEAGYWAQITIESE